jgi:hypothetical protein
LSDSTTLRKNEPFHKPGKLVAVQVGDFQTRPHTKPDMQFPKHPAFQVFLDHWIASTLGRLPLRLGHRCRCILDDGGDEHKGKMTETIACLSVNLTDVRKVKEASRNALNPTKTM